MNFESIHQKKIKGLDFFGEVAQQGIIQFEQGLQDLFVQVDEDSSKLFEIQTDEIKNKKIILAKLPEESKNVNRKSIYYKAILQEDLDTENIKKIESIRYYTNQQKETFIQIVFEMA